MEKNLNLSKAQSILSLIAAIVIPAIAYHATISGIRERLVVIETTIPQIQKDVTENTEETKKISEEIESAANDLTWIRNRLSNGSSLNPRQIEQIQSAAKESLTHLK